MTIKIGNNFCIAPFNQITFGPKGGYSPCPEIGGRPWKDVESNVVKMWSSIEFQQLRQSFLQNEKNVICNRCWDQESVGNVSLRKRLLTTKSDFSPSFNKGELIDFLDGEYKNGPKQINIMVGNVCNLKCRICSIGSTFIYQPEGKHYKTKYNLESRYYSPMPKPFVLTSDHIEQIFSLSKNLQRIEFYGGEPLLDDMSLTLLEKLIDSGQSKNISLFYNTNGTVKPSVRQYTIWNQFKNIEFNFSLDDINERFTYNRHPANWNKVIVNIAEIRSYTWSIVAKFYSICTISNLNIFYLPELLETMDNLGLPYFLNNIFGPAYYDITFLPMPIKQKVIEKLRTFKNVDKIQFLINMLNQPENLEHWEQFKFWTYEKDLYRKENFAETYPEFYKICQDYDPTFLPKNLTTAQDSV